MPVAKSYQNLPIVEGPYNLNGKMYCKVRKNTGTIQQVRWYSDKEFARLYGQPVEKKPVEFRSQKEVLGFEKGYITIFKGDTYPHLEWFRASIARYARWWGWYIISTEEIPEDLPAGLEPIQLPWELVCQDDRNLKPEDAVKKAVETLVYDPGTSEWVGSIGERIEVDIVVTKALLLDGYYGRSTLHTMEDADGNIYTWTTSSKSWAEGSEKIIRGTVKEHKVYKNQKQTVLTRCAER